jgi:1,5-anhydro-D-fructose reductase (1,5-anhydro-D-mannitol-forming)
VGPASIGWGILGTGERATQIVTEAIQQQPPITPETYGAWAVGVYSHSEARAREFARTCFLPHSFTNLADLLQRPEVHCVYIASHPRHHFALAMAALAAGKHVLCETPMALTLEEAQTMQMAAEHRGLLLGVALQLRVDPAIRQLQHLLTDELIGDLLGGYCRNTTPLSLRQQGWRLQKQAGGVLRSRTVHALDLLPYLLNDEIATIYASGTQRMLGEGENAAPDEDVQTLVTLRHSRITIQLHDSFLIPHLPTLLELYGSRGTLQVHHWADRTRASRLVLVENHGSQPLPIPPGDADQQLIATFGHAVRQQLHGHAALTSLVASGINGLQSLQAALAAHQSFQAGRLVHLPRVS